MTRPRSPALTCVALLVVGTLTACTGGGADPGPPSTPSPTPAIVVADGAGLPSTVAELPVIDAPRFDELVERSRGTPLVVNFWATWCEPCEREMPLLAAAAREHRTEIQFVGIDILDAREPAQEFLARYEVPYPNLFDASGETRDAVGSLGQPVTVFWDADGSIVAKVDGEISEAELAEHLRALA